MSLVEPVRISGPVTISMPICAARVESLEMFYEDEETVACVMIGEIGGREEEKAAEWIRGHRDMPVVFYISGRNAPPGKRMGHAGAIIEGGQGTADSKIAVLEAAGAHNAGTPDMIGETMQRVLSSRE